jgi:hypothetical protein
MADDHVSRSFEKGDLGDFKIIVLKRVVLVSYN